MKKSYLFGVASLLVMFHNAIAQATSVDLSPCVSGNWVYCAASIAYGVYLYYTSSKTGDVVVNGQLCPYTINTGWYDWELLKSATVTCGGKTGVAQHYATDKGAMEWAIKDLMNQHSTNTGLLSAMAYNFSKVDFAPMIAAITPSGGGGGGRSGTRRLLV